MTSERTICLIPGDGIGPEVVEATVQVLDAMKLSFRFETLEAGKEAARKHGTNIPPETLKAIQRAGVALKGPTETTIGGGLPSANVALRKGLDLFAALRPVKSVPNVKSRYEDVDIVVVRENTESL